MKKLSSLLTLGTVIGVAVTGLLSFRAGRKLKDENTDLKDLNNLKSVAPKVAPAVVAGVATAVSAVAAHKIDGKAVAVATATTLASLGTLKHYEAEIKDFVGPQKYEEFKKNVAKKVEQHAPFAKKAVEAPKEAKENKGENEINFMLNIGDEKPIKFKSTWYKVLTAEAHCQELMMDPEYEEATVADFKDALDLEPEGDDLYNGWDNESTYTFSSKSWIAFTHSRFTTVDGEVCYEIKTEETPVVFLYDCNRRLFKTKNQLLRAWQDGVLSDEAVREVEKEWAENE